MRNGLRLNGIKKYKLDGIEESESDGTNAFISL